MRHSPIIPNATDTVQITAHISDPDGVKTVTLRYKADNDASYQQTEMYDDGSHGDGEANDGVYGGEIPPRDANQTVAFNIIAEDGEEQSGAWAPSLNKPGLYRVEDKPEKSDFPIYRVIMTAEDTKEFESRVSLSNETMNATFIFDEKEVYYQVACRGTGSPFRRGSSGHPSGYKIRFNADEKLNGVKGMARFDRNDNSDNGYYNERISYELLRKMGVPTCQQEWVHFRLNGQTWDVVWEDILPPDRRLLSIFYPGDSDEQLFEVTFRFAFFGSPGDTSNFNPVGADFGWLGEDKNRYRWNYQPRTREREDDFVHLVELMKVLNETPDEQYEEVVGQHVNVEEWLRLMATRVTISDWDFLGTSSGQNAYLYRPSKTAKWELLSWDNEWGFQQTDMSIWANSPAIQRFQKIPTHQHLYLSLIQELIDKYFNTTYLMPWVNHYHETVNGVQPEEMETFITKRIEYLNTIIPEADAKITNAKRDEDGQIELSGSAPVQVRTVRISGVEYVPKWMDATEWQLTLPDTKTDELTVEFLNYDKQPVGMDSIKF